MRTSLSRRLDSGIMGWVLSASLLFSLSVAALLVVCATSPGEASAAGEVSGAAAPAPAAPVAKPAYQPVALSPAGFITGSVQFFLMGLGVYWLLYLRPLQRTEMEQRQFLEQLKKNDEVITTGGIFGKVLSLQGDSVTIEVSSGVKIRVRASDVKPLPGTKPRPADVKSESKGEGRPPGQAVRS